MSRIALFAYCWVPFWTFEYSILRSVAHFCGSKVSWCCKCKWVSHNEKKEEKKIHKAYTFALTRSCENNNKCMNRTLKNNESVLALCCTQYCALHKVAFTRKTNDSVVTGTSHVTRCQTHFLHSARHQKTQNSPFQSKCGNELYYDHIIYVCD